MCKCSVSERCGAAHTAELRRARGVRGTAMHTGHTSIACLSHHTPEHWTNTNMFVRAGPNSTFTRSEHTLELHGFSRKTDERKRSFIVESTRDAPIPLLLKPIRVRVLSFEYSVIPNTDTSARHFLQNCFHSRWVCN